MKLEIKDLHVSVEDKEVIKGLNLNIGDGEFHVLMGPNGSGKTSLSKTIMGHPKYIIKAGDILVDGKSIKDLTTDKIARLGIFLGFQNPIEIEGLGIINFLNAAKGSMPGSAGMPFREFMDTVKKGTSSLKLREDALNRPLNVGFSGGEKKKVEILQMSLLKPKLAILDEPDSGLDIDAVKIVAENVNEIRKQTNAGILLITHYSRILKYMEPQYVHIMEDGRIVREGGKALIEEIESKGYKAK